MGVASVEIVLDEPEATYRPGDPIAGHVVLTVEDHESDAGAAWLELGWECHGRFVNYRRSVANLDLRPNTRGPWSVGTHEIAFAFECPAWPLSYEGSKFDLDYTLWIQTDGGSGPTQTVDVFCVPGPQSMPTIALTDDDPDRQRFQPRMVTTSPLTTALTWALTRLLGDGPSPRPSTDVVDDLQFEHVPGSTMATIRVVFAQRLDAALGSLRAQMVLREFSVGRRTARAPRVDEVELDRSEGTLRRVEDDSVSGTCYEGQVPLPEAPAFTFECPDASIRWALEIYEEGGRLRKHFGLEAHP
ncbi:MAG: hypothetical protein K0V04_22325 [Deltaproteobacteria bacterium]|nr:hypothetical protein [Deltaproteobacteria bacterium]